MLVGNAQWHYRDSSIRHPSSNNSGERGIISRTLPPIHPSVKRKNHLLSILETLLLATDYEGGRGGNEIMDVRQKRSVSFKTHFFLFLFSFKFRTCITPIVPGSKQLHCEYHLGGEGGEKGSTPKTYVNDSREYARSSILRVYVFSLFEEEGGWNNGRGRRRGT